MKVMLVDDHPLFIEGLQYLLETYGIEVIGMANSGEEAFRKAGSLKPDIILMDIKMPGCGGIGALKLIKAEMPDIKIVMLTTSDEDEDLFEAIRYGASGYLLKNTSAKELIEILGDLEKGEMPLSPGLASRLLKEFKQQDAAAHKERKPQDNSEQQSSNEAREALTERQLEILELVARGVTYKEAGDILGLTERTLKYHMNRIIELFHLENRTQVIAYAVRMGIIKDQEINT